MNMVVNSSNRVKKALTAFIVAVIVLFTLPLMTKAETNAQDRTQTFIKAAGMKNLDPTATLDLSSLTGEDVKFLGVYLSNFIVPYMTDIKGSNVKYMEDSKKNMVSALSSQLGFRDADAKALVDYILSQSESTNEGAQWYFSKSPTDKGTAMPEVPNTFAELKKITAGGFGNYASYVGWTYCVDKIGEDWFSCMESRILDEKKISHNVRDVVKGRLKYAHLVVGGRIVFTADISRETITPSVAALMAAGVMSNPEKGYGTSLFDLQGEDEIKQLKNLGDTDKEIMLQSSIFGTELGVDAFGNLLALGKKHAYVILPAAANPMVWTRLGGNRGDMVQMLSSSMLSFSQNSEGSFAHTGGASGTVCTVNMNKAAAQLGERPGKTTIERGPHDIFDYRNMAYLVGRGGSADYEGALDPKIAGAFEWYNTKKKWYDRGELYNNYKDGKFFIDGLLTTTKLNWYHFSGAGTLPKATNIQCSNKSLVVDVQGLYKGTDPQANDQTISTMNLFDDSNKIVTSAGKIDPSLMNKLYSSAPLGKDDGHSSYGDPTKVMDTPTAFSTYMTYLQAAFSEEGQKSLGYKMDLDGLPKLSGNPQMSKEAKEDAAKQQAEQIDSDIRNWLWYLLNPSQGLDYFRYWIKNKIGALMVDTHNDIVGTSNAPVLAGTTKYTGFSGYVTMPELKDMEWTDKLYKGYQDYYIYVVLGFVVIAGAYAATGMLTVQRAVGSVLVFSFIAFVPLHALNYTIQSSNAITNSIYGEKFTYWALVQNQTYSQVIDDAAQGDSYQNYLQTQWAAASSIDMTGTGTGGNNKGNDSVVVKWQSPKKLRSFSFSANGLDKLATGDAGKAAASDGGGGSDALAGGNSAIMKNFVNSLDKSLSGEAYLAEDDANYLYRSYIDINNYSRYVYRGIADGTQNINTLPDTSQWSPELKKNWESIDTDTKNAISAGYNLENTGTALTTAPFHVEAALGSDIVSDTFGQDKEIRKKGTANSNTIYGFDPRAYSMSISDFTGKRSTTISKSVETSAKAFYKDADGSEPFVADMGKGYDDEDYASLAAYALISESPFFYHSWNMYDQGMSPDSSTNNAGGSGYSNLLLGNGEDSGYFYNTQGNGELRDFTDARSLFTYVIPYLRESNRTVAAYDEVYGLEYNPGVPSTPGHYDEFKDDPNMLRKYWQNLNTSYLYSVYSPWVDLMTESSYAKPETIQVQGEKVTISDPLDPSSYPANRPMIFSKSEQVDYGLRDSDLTEVERRILKYQEGSMTGMYSLLNYYNFDDSVLNTGAAMLTTFEFNKAFSDRGVLGTGTDLYPQAYELKNFSYDAYLRLILANSTGEALVDTDKVENSSGAAFYTRIMQNTSLITAGIMLVVDIMSVYIVPVMKLMLIIGLAVAMLLKILSLALRIEEGKKLARSVLDSMIIPLAMTFAVMTGFAWLVSLFMSNGNTAVTGYDGLSISLGDPVLSMIVMLGLNSVLIVCLFSILKRVGSGALATAKEVGGSIASVGSAIAHGRVFSRAAAAGGAAGSGIGGAAKGIGRGNSTPEKQAAAKLGPNSEKATSMSGKGNVTGIVGRYDDAKKTHRKRRNRFDDIPPSRERERTDKPQASKSRTARINELARKGTKAGAKAAAKAAYRKVSGSSNSSSHASNRTPNGSEPVQRPAE